MNFFNSFCCIFFCFKSENMGVILEIEEKESNSDADKYFWNIFCNLANYLKFFTNIKSWF